MTVSVSIDHLSTLTNHHFVPSVVNNFYLGSALWFKIKESAVKTVPGGDDIRVPVNRGSDRTTVRWGGRFASLPTQFQESLTQAVFSPRFYAVDITLAKTDLAKNRGNKEKLVDMIQAASESAESDLRDFLGRDIFTTGLTLDANGNRGLDGLMSALTYNADPGGSSTYAYGGISRASSSKSKNDSGDLVNSFWNGNVIAANANTTRNFWKTTVTMDNSTVLTTAKMQQMYGICTVKPELIVTSQLLYNKYSDILTTTQRALSDETIGNAGFDSLVFNGGCPVVVDDNIDSTGSMYFLNFKNMKFRPWAGMNFEPSEFKDMINQAAFTKQITLMANLVVDCPHSISVLTALTAS